MVGLDRMLTVFLRMRAETAERLNQGPAKAGATGTLRSTKTISRPRRNSTGATGAPAAAAAKGKAWNRGRARASGTLTSVRARGRAPPSVTTAAAKTNQPVRYATVLYDFAKTADVEITVNANDRVKVLQVDDGKGWMTVRARSQRVCAQPRTGLTLPHAWASRAAAARSRLAACRVSSRPTTASWTPSRRRPRRRRARRRPQLPPSAVQSWGLGWDVVRPLSASSP